LFLGKILRIEEKSPKISNTSATFSNKKFSHKITDGGFLITESE